MARNEEKAQSMLSRWIAYKRDEEKGVDSRRPQRRPALASDCETVTECEKWRMQILREVGRKVMEIQNESLGEQRIRDLNDEINKALREKGHWERRIIELGGPNYRKYERIADDAFLAEIAPGPNDDSKGYTYKYFGAARNLPGVKELFAKKDEQKAKRARQDYRGLDAEYFGYSEENDETLEKLEAEAEKKAVAEAVAQWEQQTGRSAQSATKRRKPTLPTATVLQSIAVPNKEEIEKQLLAKKKEELLKRYLGQ